MFDYTKLFIYFFPFDSFLDPFEVAYVQTTYTVIENEGSVEVCVNLTFPDFIADETVRVESFNDPTSVYIPPGAVLASKLHGSWYSYPLSLHHFMFSSS